MVLWIFANYALYGNPLYFVQAFDMLFSPEGYLLMNIVAMLSPVWYIIIYFVFLTPQVFLQAIRGFLKYTKQNNNNLTLTVLVSSYIPFLTFFAITRSSGYTCYALPIIPIFIIYASYHMVNKGNNIQTKKFLAISLTLSILMLSAITIWTTNYIQPTIQTSNWLKENAKQGKILCVYEPIIILSGLPIDRFVLLWERNVSSEYFAQFIASNNVKYIVSNYGLWSTILQNFTITFTSEQERFVVYTL
jgi:hypothetical protein